MISQKKGFYAHKSTHHYQLTFIYKFSCR